MDLFILERFNEDMTFSVHKNSKLINVLNSKNRYALGFRCRKRSNTVYNINTMISGSDYVDSVISACGLLSQK